MGAIHPVLLTRALNGVIFFATLVFWLGILSAAIRFVKRARLKPSQPVFFCWGCWIEKKLTGRRVLSENVTDENFTERAAVRSPRRRDKGRTHGTRHGLLSRNVVEVLSRKGVNVRQLRSVERELRAELQPESILEKLFFDRAWASFLRCVLAAETELNLFSPASRGGDVLVERDLPTLVREDDPPDNRTRLPEYLAVLERYDRQYFREFCRSIGILLSLKNRGDASVSRHIEKALGATRNVAEGTDADRNGP